MENRNNDESFSGWSDSRGNCRYRWAIFYYSPWCYDQQFDLNIWHGGRDQETCSNRNQDAVDLGLRCAASPLVAHQQQRMWTVCRTSTGSAHQAAKQNVGPPGFPPKIETVPPGVISRTNRRYKGSAQFYLCCTRIPYANPILFLHPAITK